MPLTSPTNSNVPHHIRVMLAIHRPLNAFTSHPITSIVVGLGLFIIGVDELIEALFPNYESFFQVHHAVIIIGLTTFLHGLIDLGERLEAALNNC